MKKIILSLMPILCVALVVWACKNRNDDGDLYWTDTPTDADSTYINPLFEPDLADPSFIRAADGWFYAYGTQNTWAQGINRITPIVRSKNLIKWDYVADAFTSASKPSWHDGGIWAPQIVLKPDDGQYYLYYSNSKWGDSNPGIGVARSANPSGPFTDKGKILDAQSSGVPNSIDQFYMTTGSGRNKKTYLFWGSYRGIYGQEIASDMITLQGAKFKIAGNGFEGTYIYEKDGVFWYFGSNNNCCDGANSQYQLSIARATNIKGPYLTKDGVDIINDGVKGTRFLHGDPQVGFVGPGHNAEIIVDDNGRSFILYHAIRYDNPLLFGGATRRPLMMDEVLWGEDGWPYIEGGVPSHTLKTAPHFNTN